MGDIRAGDFPFSVSRNPMKVLFLGLGGVGQRHLRNLKVLEPQVEIGAVRHKKRKFEITPELNADTSVDIEEKFQIQCFPDLETAAKQFQPDFAIVSTPSSLHSRNILQLIHHEIPVFVEKPISHNEEHLREIISSLGERDLPTMVGYMLRFHPAVQNLRSLVLEQAVGEIRSAHIVANTYMPDWHPYEKISDFYVGRKDLGGGTILTNIHLIDLMYWILGVPKKLWCLGGALSDFDIDVEDSVSALFLYHRPEAPLAVSLNMSFVQRPVENSITFRCEKGSINWDLGDGATRVSNVEDQQDQVFEFPEIAWNDLFVSELQHFISCLKNGTTPICDVRNTIDGHRIALAMKTSLAMDQPVNVSE
jgi:predicted dehydrogenase